MNEPSNCKSKCSVISRNLKFAKLFQLANSIKGTGECPPLEDIDTNFFKNRRVNFQNTVKLFQSFIKTREKVIWPLRACPDEILYFTDKEDRRDVKYLRSDYRRYCKKDMRIKFCSVKAKQLNLDPKNIRKLKTKLKLSRINIPSEHKLVRKAKIKLKPCSVNLSNCLNTNDYNSIKCISNPVLPPKQSVPVKSVISPELSYNDVTKPCFVEVCDMCKTEIPKSIATLSSPKIEPVNDENSEDIETDNVNSNMRFCHSEITTSYSESNLYSKDYQLKDLLVVLDDFLSLKPLTRKQKSLILPNDHHKSVLSSKTEDSNSVGCTDSTSSIVSDCINGYL